MLAVPEHLQPPQDVPTFAAEGEWARFRARTVVCPAAWVWLGSLGGDGYPTMWARLPEADAAGPVRLSRWVYAAYHGPLPAGTVIRHSCDLTICVRPDDLIPGSQSDNLRDAVRRDRVTNPGRVGKADRRGPAMAARAVRQAVTDALAGGVHAPDALATIVAAVLSDGDPYASQIPLF